MTQVFAGHATNSRQRLATKTPTITTHAAVPSHFSVRRRRLRRGGGMDEDIGARAADPSLTLRDLLRRHDLDAAVLVEVHDHQLAVVLAQLHAVEPELVVLAVGEPRAGLALAALHHHALDGGGHVAAEARHLLGDPDSLAGDE